MDFPGDSAGKNLPANAKDADQSLGQEDQPLKKEMAAHSSIVILEIVRTKEIGRLWSMGPQAS